MAMRRERSGGEAQPFEAGDGGFTNGGGVGLVTGGGRGAAPRPERVWDTHEKRDGKRTGENRGGAGVRGAGQPSWDSRWENNWAAHI